jgi:recombinase-like zinc beta ribbon protein
MTEAGWLSGAVWCEECKQKVWHQKSGRQAALRYYRCSGIHKRVCQAPMARAETLEDEMLAILGMLTIPSDLAVAVVAAARQLGKAPEVAPLPPDRGVDQKLVQLQQAYDAEILTRAEYERKRKALLAAAHACSSGRGKRGPGAHIVDRRAEADRCGNTE